MTNEEHQKIVELQAADQARREQIFNKVRDFDVFLRTIQFEKEDIGLLVVSRGIRHAKKVE